ncbi:MAG: regulatory iron-sulfur-containing complex subunit RicT [Desulfatibacillaceae bacterium]
MSEVGLGKVVGIRFKPSGKVYDFDSGVFVVNVGDKVIVETEQGLGFGTVCRAPRPTSEELLKKPLKKIFRLATAEDLDQHEHIIRLEKEAFEYCENQIEKLGLEMSLFSVDATFDTSKLTFFFTAEGRVDFRELVKILVRHFRTRIELRQIGVRHQAKMCGGLGRCGRETCCTTFMGGFMPVSVKMAKIQNLSLNPTKISGLCGRLMCCLTFEHETYRELSQAFPKIGRQVETPQGRGKVIRHNVIQDRVTVRLLGGPETDIYLKDIGLAPPEDGNRRPAEEKPSRNQGQPPKSRERDRTPPAPPETEAATEVKPPAEVKEPEPGSPAGGPEAGGEDGQKKSRTKRSRRKRGRGKSRGGKPRDGEAPTTQGSSDKDRGQGQSQGQPRSKRRKKPRKNRNPGQSQKD